MGKNDRTLVLCLALGGLGRPVITAGLGGGARGAPALDPRARLGLFRRGDFRHAQVLLQPNDV